MPQRLAGACRIGLRPAVGVRRVHRVGDVGDPHRPVLGVAVDLGLRGVHRNLAVVHPEPGAVRVGVGEVARQQHLVRAQPGTWDRIVRLERRLLHLGVVVADVAIQGQPADIDQRVVAVRPHLRQVERVEPVVLGVLERHDLHLQRPAGEIAPLDRVEQVALVGVTVLAGHLIALVLGEELDALIGLEVVFHPEDLAGGVDPAVGVAGVTVHVPPGARDPAVTHQPGDLVCRLRRQRPEVPLHIVVAQVVGGPALLRPDEMLELHRVADEEHRSVVADHVEIAVRCVELGGETARVAPGVRAAALTGDGGEPGQRLGFRPGLQECGLGVGADICGHFEMAEGATALGMRLALRDPLAVEVRHLLDQIVILQQDGAVGTDGQGMLVAVDRYPGVRGGRFGLCIRHHCSSRACVRTARPCTPCSRIRHLAANTAVRLRYSHTELVCRGADTMQVTMPSPQL